MTWTTARRDRLPPDWRQRKTAVHERDRWTCQHILPPEPRHPASIATPPPPRICGWHDPTGATVECDHRTPGDDHRLTNLVTLCGRGSPDNHHATKSALEGVQARAHRHGPRQRPHPGLVPE